MEGSRRNSLNKLSNPQFKRKGFPNKGNNHAFVPDESSESFGSSVTVYEILCQSNKIGSVIGKGGDIVKSLREETRAKITVADSVLGSDERLITISSLSDKQANRKIADYKSEKGNDDMEPHCAAQDALLKIHDRIAREDLLGAVNDDEEKFMITARLLVANNMVGCLLGRKGDVIQRLRSETGANIRVLPAHHLRACAMSTDEVVQISGKPRVVKKALFEISTLLHQNPRKDKPPLKSPSPYSSQSLHPPGSLFRDMLRSENLPWLERTVRVAHKPPLPWEAGNGIRPSAFRPDDFDVVPLADREAPSEFTMKILCSAEKAGGVIGKGGAKVRQLEQETGARVHVDDVSSESDERVIRVSSFEVLWDQRSQTIDAILQLQSKTSEYSEKGTITTRLLVPSNKVGCILGEGGHVINEMRRRTRADIRVLSKKDKPKCASVDEELVQISGSLGVAKDALVEIASRLRTRFLRDASGRGEPAPLGPVREFNATGDLHDNGFLSPDVLKAGSSGRYDHLKVGFHGYESPRFPVALSTTRYLDMDEGRISSASARGASHISEFAGARERFQDPYSSDSDFSSLDRYNASRDRYHSPVSSTGRYNSPQPGLHPCYNSHNGEYPDVDVYRVPYQNSNAQPLPHQNIYAQPGPYRNTRGHYSYPIDAQFGHFVP